MREHASLSLYATSFCLALMGSLLFGVAPKALGQEGITVRIHEGAVPGGRFGLTVTAVEDLNSDGSVEYVIGAPNENVIRMYDGNSGTLLWTRGGEGASDSFGISLGTLDDVNGDGIQEILVGATRHDPPQVTSCFAGKAYVLSGVDGTTLFSNDGLVQAGKHGGAVAGLGDVDGDSVADFLVGAPGHLFLGRFTVYSGATGASIYAIDGSNVSPGLGRIAAGLGDVDGDGRADYVVGSLSTVTVYSGATGSVLLVLDEARESVANVGDVTLDGVDDFAIGGVLDDGNRNVEVYSGADFSLLYTVFAQVGVTWFGRSISRAGDSNGDGVPDIAVGGPSSPSVAGLYGGRVCVYDGATGAGIWDWIDAPGRSCAGISMALISDLNCDGRPELLVGGDFYDPTGTGANIVGGAFAVSFPGLVSTEFIRGDASGDSTVSLTDAIVILPFLFGNQPIPCEVAADIDDSGTIGLNDVILLINHLFVPGSAPPAPPFPDCGSDPVGDTLCCEIQVVGCP